MYNMYNICCISNQSDYQYSVAKSDFGLKLTSKMPPGPGRGLPIKRKLTQQVAKPSRAGAWKPHSDTATMRAISPRIKTSLLTLNPGGPIEIHKEGLKPPGLRFTYSAFPPPCWNFNSILVVQETSRSTPGSNRA